MQRLLMLGILAGLSVFGLSLWQWNEKRPKDVNLDQLEKMGSVPDAIVLWGDVGDSRRLQMIDAQRWDQGIIAGYGLVFFSTGLLGVLRGRGWLRKAGVVLLLTSAGTVACDLEANRRLSYVLENDVKTLQGNSGDTMLPLSKAPRDVSFYKWILFCGSSALVVQCGISLLRKR